jgi:hypothetical protein
VAHLLTLLIIDPVGEVYGVVEKGGLRGGRGDNWDLAR